MFVCVCYGGMLSDLTTINVAVLCNCDVMYLWMDDKRILEWKPIGMRIRGRPRKKWIVDIEEDMQIMGIRRWIKQCEERTEWERITEKAKTHSGL